MSQGFAANTESAYRSAWRLFVQWCTEAGRAALPASPETLSFYATALLEEGYAVTTVRVKLAAIGSHHVEDGFVSPVDHTVRLLVSHAARLLQQKPNPKATMTPDQLKRILGAARLNTARDDRNRAILCLGFKLGWRRSELVSLDLADVSVSSRSLGVRLGKSKTDQKGKGRNLAIPRSEMPDTCAIQNLQRWLKARGDWKGPLFCRIRKPDQVTHLRLSAKAVCEIVQDLLEKAGADQSLYGAHSMRSGMITASAENGADPFAIMQFTGHRSMQTVLNYIRPVQAFRNYPLAGVV